MGRIPTKLNNTAFENKRIEKGLSLEALGLKIGESKYNLKVLEPSQVYKVINGERNVSHLEALAFKKILGLTQQETIEFCTLYEKA